MNNLFSVYHINGIEIKILLEPQGFLISIPFHFLLCFYFIQSTDHLESRKNDHPLFRLEEELIPNSSRYLATVRLLMSIPFSLRISVMA